jgi:hypothetical protein
MNKKQEIQILEQASNFYTEMVFISKENFLKIKFWFEPEKSIIQNGNLLDKIFIILIDLKR